MVLIPALLLAGGLVRKGDDAATEWYEKAIAALMVVIVIAGVGGELVAINGAFSVNPSEASMRVVVAVLALGTIVIGGRTARHWLDGLVSAGTGRTTIYVIGLALGLAAAVGTQIAVTDTIHKAQAAQQIAAKSR